MVKVKKAFPPDLVYDSNDIIAKDFTDSDKTLASCLPLIEKFRKEDNFASNGWDHDRRRLLAIVITPTRYLALQVHNKLKTLKHYYSKYKLFIVYGSVSIQNLSN